MSQSKRNFILGISLLLAVILLIGCLPNKQGGFSCVCAPLISKIKSMLPGPRPKPPDISPVQPVVNPSSGAGDSSMNWWQSLPDLQQEQKAIDVKISALSKALAAKNTDQALSYLQVEERERYRQMLSRSPGIMPKMAAGLNTAKLNFLSAESTQYSRVAEYSITQDGHTFHIEFIKVDGQWMLKNY
jgi:hypothetical protein